MTQMATQIQCPTGLFGQQEAKIEMLTKSINAARIGSEKLAFVHDLIDEVNVLMACASYDQANPNCCLCHGFSELRLQTADVIAMVGALGGR
ncbi:MAG: hypothetical protein K8F92_03195 [Hyphomicrobium sp.]|uniref:hypothetical protein n=1 Tax=Hyphomicrobium sp. TaxID=82 RepID=UPI00132C230A|nr:hypothetical protein [Hyphomicrobium sp.]KAB2939868.1 MAG: hypothetical protein F9K20_15510 [Hyphomicrobium sp.]MBZ0208647.1 hypothetical protein [Hyphomicrobium sp.]